MRKARLFLFAGILVAISGTAPADAGDTIAPLTCPYLKKDAVSAGMIDQLVSSLNNDLNVLRDAVKNQKECAGIPVPAEDVTSLIGAIATQVTPYNSVFKNLTVGGKALACPGSTGEFGGYLRHYLDNTNAVIGYEANDRDAAQMLTLGGIYGSVISQRYVNCYQRRRDAYRGKSEGRAAADLEFDRCLKSDLGLAANGNLSGSDLYLINAWGTDCSENDRVADGAQVWDIVQRSALAAQKRVSTQVALKSAFGAISDTLGQMTDPSVIANLGDGKHGTCGKGAIVARTANSLVTTALRASEVLGVPWVGLVTALMERPLSNLIGSIGSGAQRAKRLESLIDRLKSSDEDRFGIYACQLMSVQRLTCEMNQGNDGNESVSGARAPVVQDGPKRYAALLGDTADYFVGKSSRQSASVHNGDSELIYRLFGNFGSRGEEFEIPVIGSIESISLYDFLFVAQSFSRVLPTAPPYAPAAADSTKGILEFLNRAAGLDGRILPLRVLKGIDVLQREVKPRAEKFRTCIVALSSGDAVSGCTATWAEGENDGLMKILSGIDFQAIFVAYLELYKDSGSASGASKSFAIRALEHLNGYVIGSGASLVDSVTASVTSLGVDESSDRFGKVRRLFDAFNDYSKPGYIQTQVMRSVVRGRLKRIEELKSTFAKQSEVVSQNGFFDREIYPVMRDCLLGYQFAVRKGDLTSPIGTLDPEFAQMCHMLSHCNRPGKNSLGIRLSYSEGPIRFDTNNTETMAPVCQTLSDYYTVIDRGSRELREEGKICGKSVFDPDFF